MKWTQEEVEKKLKCFAIGISNIAEIDNKKYGLQFYDLDKSYSDLSHEEFFEYWNKIKHLFENRDCIYFRTKHGIHFVSFSIDFIHSLKYYQRRVKKVSKKLNQDYRFNKSKYLVLRISPKKREIISKKTKEPINIIVSGRPRFIGVLNKPTKDMFISSDHLKIYNHYIGLPSKVLREYLNNSQIVQSKIKLHTYRTSR